MTLEYDPLKDDESYREGYDTGYFAGFEAALKVIRNSSEQSKIGLVNQLEEAYTKEVFE
jgi:hypothetical protein